MDSAKGLSCEPGRVSSTCGQINARDRLVPRLAFTQSLEGAPIKDLKRDSGASVALAMAAVEQVIAVGPSVEQVARWEEMLYRCDGLPESDRPHSAGGLIDDDALTCSAKRCSEAPGRLAVRTGLRSASTQ
jgi:hypothetical protein